MELHNPQKSYSVQFPSIPRANFSPKRFRKALSNVCLISRKLRLTRNAVSPTALRRFHHPPLAYFSLLKAIISIDVKRLQSIFLRVWMWSSVIIHLTETVWKTDKDVIKVNSSALLVSPRFRRLTCKIFPDIEIRKKSIRKCFALCFKLFGLNWNNKWGLQVIKFQEPRFKQNLSCIFFLIIWNHRIVSFLFIYPSYPNTGIKCCWIGNLKSCALDSGK